MLSCFFVKNNWESSPAIEPHKPSSGAECSEGCAEVLSLHIEYLANWHDHEETNTFFRFSFYFC